MKILFLTMSNFGHVSEHSIYTDLVRELVHQGNQVTVLLPIEKRNGKPTSKETQCGATVIKVCTGNLFDVGMAEKLVSRAGVVSRFEKALDAYCADEVFDLIIYSTPPTTFGGLVAKLKKKYNAYTYLMLKDIFPQNAVDLGMIGQKGLPFRVLREGEKKLYRSADTIGCMSPANVRFLKNQDPWIDPKKITVFPNALEVREPAAVDKAAIRGKYNLPNDKLLLVYGGNLSKPQGIEYFKKCIEAMTDDADVFFLVIGSGPFLSDLQALESKYPQTLRVIQWLPVDEYETLVAASDVGLIFLDHRFKIPNFPSRLLLYLQCKLPILAATDPNTDVGTLAESYGCGFRCESRNPEDFRAIVDKVKPRDVREAMGEKAYTFLKDMFSVDVVVRQMLDRVKAERGENA